MPGSKIKETEKEEEEETKEKESKEKEVKEKESKKEKIKANKNQANKYQQKLNWVKVRNIRKLLKEDRLKEVDIAYAYKVGISTIREIRARKIWKNDPKES